MFKLKWLYKKARQKGKVIVFPEAGFSDRIIEAVRYIVKKKIAKVLLIGDESALVLRYKKLKNVTIINPKTSALTSELAESLFKARSEKGVSKEEAYSIILDPFYFATMLVKEGYADGMLGGAEVSTARNIKPALQLIKQSPQYEMASSCFLMYGKNKITNNQPFIMGDCALIEKPNAQQLCSIAEQCVTVGESLINLKPRVAFLSYSTNGSANGPDILKVQEATKLFKSKNRLVFCEGEVQFDAAMVPEIAKTKFPNSNLANNFANVLIFPDLNSGNICYKAIQNFGGLTAIGPIITGLNKPVNDLSRGCTVKDIVIMTAITVLQCE